MHRIQLSVLAFLFCFLILTRFLAGFQDAAEAADQANHKTSDTFVANSDYRPGDAITPADYPSIKAPAMKFGMPNAIGTKFAKDPSVVRFKGKYWMYFSLFSLNPKETGYNLYIGVAVSDDLTDWKYVGKVTPLCDGDKKGLGAPCAKVWDDQVHLFYQSYGNGPKDAIYYAVSTDGLNFKSQFPTAIFSPKGDWTNGRAIDADFFEFKGRCFLYAATRDPAGRIQKQVVATAESRDDLGPDKWTQFDGSILEPQLPWETNCIEAATVCQRDGKLFMFYAGGFNNDPQHIGLAQSEDGIHWKRVWNVPFITNGPAGQWNHSESGHPGVFIDPETGKTWLFYQGNDDRGKSWYLSRVELEWIDGLPKVK